MEKNKENPEGWALRELKITYNSFGVDVGTYSGVIRFQNKKFDSFSFSLTPELVGQFMPLISDQIIKSAGELSDNLLESLKPVLESKNEK